MERFEKRELYRLRLRLDRELNGEAGNLPIAGKSDDARGFRFRVGAVGLEPGSRQYGRTWKLVRFMNEGGGERVILSGWSARELWELGHAYLDGLEEGRKLGPDPINE